MELRKYVTPEIVHGRGARGLVGRYAHNIGVRTALVVSDAGVVAAGWTAEIVRSLQEQGIEARLFDGVTANPRTSEVAAGVEAARAHRCDALVAVGGGSPIDCAKGIGIALVHPGSAVEEFAGVDRIANPIPPLVCIPTTCGSSADVSQFAILTDADERLKFAIVSKAIVPDVALVDPDLVRTLPRRDLACSAMDALVHGLEAYTSNAHAILTDAHALAAVDAIREHLAAALADPASPSRAALVAASLQAGLAFSNASLGAVHAMAHAVGGLVDNPHGEANAMLVEHVVAFNYDADPDRHDALARRLGVDLAGRGPRERRDLLVAALRGVRRAAGLELRLRDRGIRRDDLPLLARRAAADPCLVTNVRRATAADLEAIYAEAL